MKKIIISTMLLLVGLMSAAANDIVSLKFNRTGTDAASVTVSVVDGEGNAIEGASASLTSVSPALRGTAGSITSSIVCPNANANTSPTITMTFTVAGLPEGYTFDKLGLHIHALNGNNGYQETNDNKVRQWNVSAAAGGNAFASFSDIDIAAGITGANKLWETDQFSSVGLDAKGNLVLTLTITKGTTNGGCFFGLSEVKFTTTAVEPEPDPTVEHTFSADKVYYIQWKNTGANYITENRDKSLTVADKKNSKYQFWRLIPVEGKSHCYYIQNVVTANYIETCKKDKNSKSYIYTSTEKREYYIGQTTSTSANIAGCYYMSSTDCADYSDESKNPLALNKDGGSNGVLTWTAGHGSEGSYWKIVETTEEWQAPEPPVHGSSAKNLTVYFRPCGMTYNTYLTAATISGVDPIAYAATDKPGSFYVPFSKDHGAVVRGSEFNVSITLSSSSADDKDLKANAYFDWNADGDFEITAPITLDGTAGTASVTVPDDAVSGDTRMRIRLNSNGLDRADDDVEGFVYDIPFAVVGGERKVLVEVNGANNGTATLSGNAETYAVGTQLTATATPKGNATFDSWREGGVVVSREAEYTFAVANRNMTLKAYFTPNTESEAIPAQWDITFTRTSTTEATATVTRDGKGAPVEGVTATITITGGDYQNADQTASNKDILCINRNTTAATEADPNKYTLTITNNSDKSYIFDYVAAAGVALNSGGAYQPDDTQRSRNMQVTCGDVSLPAELVSICDNDHCYGKETFHAFAQPITVASGASYTIQVAIYTDSGLGCFYGLKRIALGGTRVTIGSTGYTTLYTPIAMTVPEEVSIYKGDISDDNTLLTLTAIPHKTAIPHETAVLIKGEPNSEFTYEVANRDADKVTGNDLKGHHTAVDASTVNAGDNEVYTLQSHAEYGVAFKRYIGDMLTGGKAYLMLPKSLAAENRAVRIHFADEDDSTQIENSEITIQNSEFIYDLMGRRVLNPAKGVYIVGGRKVVIK